MFGMCMIYCLYMFAENSLWFVVFLGNRLRYGWGTASPSMGVCMTDLLILKCTFDIRSLVLGILLACRKVTRFYEIVGYW